VNKEWNEYESHPWNGTGVIARRATLGIAQTSHTRSMSISHGVYLLSAAAMFWAFENCLLQALPLRESPSLLHPHHSRSIFREISLR